MKKVNAYYGWRPDKPDIRDFRYKVAEGVVIKDAVDLRSGLPECYDQGQLGSCTANAIAGALEFDMRQQKETRAATPSRLFIYYNERVMEGDVSEDAGAEIRDGIKSVHDIGAPAEKYWPYVISKFAHKPPKSTYTKAAARKSLVYQRLDNTNVNQLLSCLSSGFPFVFGFTVYEYFESDQMSKDGILKLPTSSEQVLGGHAVLAVGYDKSTNMFLVRNSWGSDWGYGNGHFWMPFLYAGSTDLADDFWQIQTVK